MLPKKERLITEEIILLENGKSVFGPRLALRYLPAANGKFAVSVSKKVLKNAVDRNRMRRRVYAALDGIRKKIKKNAFVMIMPKKDCLIMPMQKLKNEITDLFIRAGLWI